MATQRTFGSLATRNYRLFFGGSLVSATGGWMSTMAEAWLVNELTHDGTAVGTTFAFRFAAVLLLGLWGGAIVDRFDRRKLLLGTQVVQALLAIGLWALVVADVVDVWMVFGFAFLTGCVTALEQPAQHAFVEEMVGPELVANAVALNSAVVNSARITGPALAGVVIAQVGTSWVFFVNAISFSAVVVALLAMRTRDLHPVHRSADRPRIREGLSYAWGLIPIRPTIVLVGVVGTLVYNFPTFLTILAEDTYDGGAGLAGLLMAVLGVGTLVGALAAARLAHPTARTVGLAALLTGGALLLAAAMPSKALLLVALVPLGATSVFFGSTANAHMQVWSDLAHRGRVMALYSLLTMGSTVIGGPLTGWVSERWSASVAMALAGGVVGLVAATLGLRARRERARTAEPIVVAEAVQAAEEVG